MTGDRRNYGIQGTVNARNVAVGPHATITDAGSSISADLDALSALIDRLPPGDRTAAKAGVERLRLAAAPDGDRAAVPGALAAIEGAAKQSLGIVDAAEKIVAIALRLGALLI